MTTQGAVRALSDLHAFLGSEADLNAVGRETISSAEGRPPEAVEIDALANVLHSELQRLVAQAEMNQTQLGQVEGGLLRMDALGLAFLSAFGKAGKLRADELEHDARLDALKYGNAPHIHHENVWRRWYQGLESRPPFAVVLAEALWWNDVRPAIRDAAAKAQETSSGVVDREKSPAISATVFRRVLKILFLKDLPKVGAVAGQVQFVGDGGELLGGVSADMVSDARLKKLLKSTRSVLGHRLFRRLAGTGVTSNSRVLEIEGGLTGLAKMLQVRSKKAPTQLREILDAFSCIKIQLPHGAAEALLTWSLTPEAPGRPATLRITPHDVFRPDYVVTLPKATRTQREGRRLCPVPTESPPLAAGPRTYAAQLTLQMLLALELSEQAEAFYETGGWLEIPEERWREFGAMTGLGFLDQLPEVLGEWVKHGFLRQDPDHSSYFTFYDEWPAKVLSFSTGQRSAKGRARQALSAKTKK